MKNILGTMAFSNQVESNGELISSEQETCIKLAIRTVEEVLAVANRDYYPLFDGSRTFFARFLFAYAGFFLQIIYYQTTK
ncbi:MAG: hypothetical protein GY820_33500 [Gammaproteobacteria bacterium]|nr:hypothetical protein [Gammaproteobacteria bacterium]